MTHDGQPAVDPPGDGAAGASTSPETGRADQQVVVLTGPLGRRQDRRGQAVRGSRLRRGGQPARRAAAGPGRPDRHRARPLRRGPPSCSTCGPATCPWRSGRCAARSRAAGSGRSSSSSRRSDEVLIRRFSETRHRHPLADERGHRRVHRARAGDAGVGPRPGRRRPRHERPVAARAAGADLRPPGGRPGLRSARDPAHQLRLQVRGAARGGPRARRPVHEEPPLHRGAAARSRASPRRCAPTSWASRSRTSFLDRAARTCSTCWSRPTPTEGKTRLTIAIGCTGGWHRSIVMAEELAALAAGTRLRAGLGLPPGAGAVNLRRWLTVGIGVKRWLLLAFLGLLDPRARASPTSSAR